MGCSDHTSIQPPIVQNSKDHPEFDKRTLLICKHLSNNLCVEYPQSTHKLSESGSSCPRTPSISKSENYKYDLSLTEEKVTYTIVSKTEKMVYINMRKGVASLLAKSSDLMFSVIHEKKLVKQELHNLQAVCLEQTHCSLTLQHKVEILIQNYDAGLSPDLQVQPVAPQTVLSDTSERPLDSADTAKVDRVSNRVVTPMKGVDTVVTVPVEVSALVRDTGIVHRTSEREASSRKGAQSLNRVSDRMVSPTNDATFDQSSHCLENHADILLQQSEPPTKTLSDLYQKCFKTQTLPAIFMRSAAISEQFLMKLDTVFQSKMQHQLQFLQIPACCQHRTSMMCLAFAYIEILMFNWLGTAFLQWKLATTVIFKDSQYYCMKHITAESFQINWANLMNTIFWKTLKSEHITAMLSQIPVKKSKEVKDKCCSRFEHSWNTSGSKVKKSQQILSKLSLQQPHHGEITWVNKRQWNDPPFKLLPQLESAEPHSLVAIPGHLTSAGKVPNETEEANDIDVSNNSLKVKKASTLVRRIPEESGDILSSQEITTTTQCTDEDARNTEYEQQESNIAYLNRNNCLVDHASI
ncbi:uncharacterized protein [Dysidea avara]|uniref:uncharacterized protein n=1 Tax=Dysidea avara TaxID=196820 RepID=UPI00331EF032